MSSQEEPTRCHANDEGGWLNLSDPQNAQAWVEMPIENNPWAILDVSEER